jgi:hypothetical protein
MNTKDFYRLLGAYFNFDGHIDFNFYEWHLEEYGKPPDPEFHRTIDIQRYPKDGMITIKFDNRDDLEYDVPLSVFCDESDDDPKIYMLWHSNYYDGPLSGMALYEGKKVWFECDEWEHDNLYHMRTFNLYELSEEEIAEEEYWHELFRKHVGWHSDYGDRYAQCGAEGTSDGNWDAFYKKAEKERPKRDYSKNKCLGTFDETFFIREKIDQ